MTDMGLGKLVPFVREAGTIGMEGQKNAISTYKDDGSVLTQYDVKISSFLCEKIRNLFSSVNIITEEEEYPFDPQKPYTFAVDPIDGTDAYSQGMPGWAISVGLLDQWLTPVAGIIYAPEWNSPTGESTFIFSDIGGDVYINDKLLTRQSEWKKSASMHQIMVSSRVHRDLDLKTFPGKLRNTGGTVLNIAALLLYHRVIGTIVSPCHIWDLAAAHGIIRNAGMDMEYLSGKSINYGSMLNGESADEYMLAGTREHVERIRSYTSSVIPS